MCIDMSMYGDQVISCSTIVGPVVYAVIGVVMVRLETVAVEKAPLMEAS